MLRAASAIACRPEEQKRLTVWPAAVTGRPARMAHWRAMLPPVAPSGLAQPIITSSTSPGSMPARLTAWRDHVAAHVGAVGEVEGAAHGSADRRAGGGDDDGVDHGVGLLCLINSLSLSSRGLSPASTYPRAPEHAASLDPGGTSTGMTTLIRRRLSFSAAPPRSAPSSTACRRRSSAARRGTPGARASRGGRSCRPGRRAARRA